MFPKYLRLRSVKLDCVTAEFHVLGFGCAVIPQEDPESQRLENVAIFTSQHPKNSTTFTSPISMNLCFEGNIPNNPKMMDVLQLRAVVSVKYFQLF